MLRFVLNTTLICPNACSYCPLDQIPKGNYRGIKTMTWEIFKNCIDNCPEGTVFHFSGLGEPFINPRCTDMILYVYEKGHDVLVYTTMSHTTVEDIERLKHIPFVLWQTHVPDEKGLFSEKKLIQPKEKYEALRDNIKKLRITCVGGTPVQWAKDIFGDIIEEVPIWGRAGHLDNGLADIPSYSTVKCGKYLMKHMVWPDGSVCVCCIDFQNDFEIGNLQDHNFFKERPSKLQKIIDLQKDPNSNIICKRCEFAIPLETKQQITSLPTLLLLD